MRLLLLLFLRGLLLLLLSLRLSLLLLLLLRLLVFLYQLLVVPGPGRGFLAGGHAWYWAGPWGMLGELLVVQVLVFAPCLTVGWWVLPLPAAPFAAARAAVGLQHRAAAGRPASEQQETT